jgi:hypothetical protein
MAGKKLDIAALAARLGELNKPAQSGEGSGVSFVDIKDGRNQVRILPGKDDINDFYKEVWVHYGVGKSANNKGTFLVCPTTADENAYCPVCALSKQFKKMSKKKDDNHDKQAKSIYRKKRVYYNAIDRAVDLSKFTKNEDGKWLNAEGEEESPVKVLGTGVEVFKGIVGLLIDPEYGQAILDTEEGLDLIITKTGSGQYSTSYDVKATRKEVPLDFDEWHECLNDLEALAKIKPQAEIEAIMNGEEPSGKDDSDDEEEDDGKPVDISENPDDAEQDALQAEIQEVMRRRKQGK